MQELELLIRIRSQWIERAIHHLSSGSSASENLAPELGRFFDLLEAAISAGDPNVLDPVLLEWSTAQANSVIQSTNFNLIEFLNKLLVVSLETARENLSQHECLALSRTLAIIFGKALARAADLDAQVKLPNTTNQLSQVRQSLEKLDHTKSDFIAITAHELKTPLTLIDGYASMLRESLERVNINSYQSMLLEGIQQGAQRLHAIINDMIDASLVDNHILNLNFQPVWINQLLSSLETETGPAINARQQQLEIHPFDGMNQMTYADPERLLQALRIVLTNAIKFTPDGGNLSIGGRQQPGFVEITISDSGIGIDPEYLTLIFEKFVHLGATALHSSSKIRYKGGGPGLGLHIAKGIIESHGGTIWAESPGFDEQTCPGSTFHIMVPIRSEPPDVNMAKLFAPLRDSAEEKGN